MSKLISDKKIAECIARLVDGNGHTTFRDISNELKEDLDRIRTYKIAHKMGFLFSVRDGECAIIKETK